MLKKYIDGFTAMRYVIPEFAMTVAILILAFIYPRTEMEWLRPVIGALSVGVMITIALYVKDRIHTGKQLKQIKKQKEFANAIVLGYAFFLENRMAAYAKGNVGYSADYSNISDAKLITGKHGKQAVVLTIDGKEYEAQITTSQQGERLAAFLKIKNPNINLHGMKTKGSGTFRSIDLVPAEKAMNNNKS